jgi:hypothetical protein
MTKPQQLTDTTGTPTDPTTEAHRVEQIDLKRPGFDAPSVMCERPVGRHGSVHSSRPRLRRVGVGRGGA